MENKEIVVIGNKPYKNLKLNKILDSFNRNARCNMSAPNLNNGTKHDVWGLCAHMYDKIIKDPVSEDNLVQTYQDRFYPESIRQFYQMVDTTKYSQIVDVLDLGFGWETKKGCNKILSEIGCPFRFSKDPRMGYVFMFYYLKQDYKVYISNWSVTSEPRVSYYIKPDFYESIHHHAPDEIKILRWLHSEGIVDASLCLLEDKKEYSFIEDELKPTSFITNLLNTQI